MAQGPMLGHKVRRLRQDRDVSQVALAGQLGISPSYLNLIEHNQRPLTMPLLLKLGQEFNVDLRSFSDNEDARLMAPIYARSRPARSPRARVDTERRVGTLLRFREGWPSGLRRRS